MPRKAKSKVEKVVEEKTIASPKTKEEGNIYKVSPDHASEITKKLAEVSKLEIAIGRLSMQRKEVLRKFDAEEENMEAKIKSSREKFKAYFEMVREMYVKNDPNLEKYEYIDSIKAFRLPQQPESGLKLVSKDEHKH